MSTDLRGASWSVLDEPGELPVILFGDHTREWKFLEFPFAPGADGTQLLRGRHGTDQRFMFYALKALPLKNLGYSRHFKLLKELSVALPPLPEQQKIAAILTSVDEAIEATQAVIDQLQVVKKAMMAELLTRGLPGRHTRFKMTEIGEVPEGWTIELLDDLIAPGRPICYGVLKPGVHVPGGVPVIRITDYRGDRLDVASVQRSSPEVVAPFARSTLQGGDILISIRGTAGRVCVIPENFLGANISRDSARISLKNSGLADFIFCYLRSPQAQSKVMDEMRGMAVRGINIEDLRKLPVPIPGPAERHSITRSLLGVDAVIENNIAEKAALTAIKAALLSPLLSGEVRVKPDAEAL